MLDCFSTSFELLKFGICLYNSRFNLLLKRFILVFGEIELKFQWKRLLQINLTSTDKMNNNKSAIFSCVVFWQQVWFCKPMHQLRFCKLSSTCRKLQKVDCTHYLWYCKLFLFLLKMANHVAVSLSDCTFRFRMTWNKSKTLSNRPNKLINRAL